MAATVDNHAKTTKGSVTLPLDTKLEGSSALRRIRYFPDTQDLLVNFQPTKKQLEADPEAPGAYYRYRKVPLEAYLKVVIGAKNNSNGSTFHQEIKLGGYEFERLPANFSMDDGPSLTKYMKAVRDWISGGKPNSGILAKNLQEALYAFPYDEVISESEDLGIESFTPIGEIKVLKS